MLEKAMAYLLAVPIIFLGATNAIAQESPGFAAIWTIDEARRFDLGNQFIAHGSVSHITRQI